MANNEFECIPLTTLVKRLGCFKGCYNEYIRKFGHNVKSVPSAAVPRDISRLRISIHICFRHPLAFLYLQSVGESFLSKYEPSSRPVLLVLPTQQ
jgi:hypothetical protein